MRVAEAEGTLKEMLTGAGVDLERPDPLGVWRTFKDFMTVSAEDAPWTEGFRDGMLFDWGLYDWGDGNGERFQVDFTRQFSLYADDVYDHMEQLRCTFYFEPSGALRRLGSGNLWGDPEKLESWIEDVEQQAAFAALDRQSRPAGQDATSPPESSQTLRRRDRGLAECAGMPPEEGCA